MVVKADSDELDDELDFHGGVEREGGNSHGTAGVNADSSERAAKSSDAPSSTADWLEQPGAEAT